MGLYPKLLLLVGSIFLLGGVVIIPLLYAAESARIEQEGFDRAEMLAYTEGVGARLLPMFGAFLAAVAQKPAGG